MLIRPDPLSIMADFCGSDEIAPVGLGTLTETENA